MLPIIEDEVKRFYSELNIEKPVVQNPFIHRVAITSWKKKVEVCKLVRYFEQECRLILSCKLLACNIYILLSILPNT